MKRISFLLILFFITGILFSCNDSSSSKKDKGYVDPGNWGGIERNTNKAYNLAGALGSCSGASCLSLIYHGELDKTDYVGIAVKNGTNTLKIYWAASSIPLGANAIDSCTVIYNGAVTSNVTINVNISDNSNGTYHIIFNGPVTGSPILGTNTIDALVIE